MAHIAWSSSTTPFPAPVLPRTLYGFNSGPAGGSRAPVWPGFTFPNGTVGNAYSVIFDLTPASAPTTYTLVSGALPTGLSLSNVTGDQGQISGTPTVAAAYAFTLRATNSYGTADQAFSITIVAAGSGYSFCFTS